MDAYQAAQNLWKAYGRPLRNIVSVGVGRGRDQQTIIYVYTMTDEDGNGIPSMYEGYEVVTKTTGSIIPL